MKIALIGYGKMGKTIEQIALERGHEITIRANNTESIDLPLLKNSDVAIEFSHAGNHIPDTTPLFAVNTNLFVNCTFNSTGTNSSFFIRDRANGVDNSGSLTPSLYNVFRNVIVNDFANWETSRSGPSYPIGVTFRFSCLHNPNGTGFPALSSLGSNNISSSPQFVGSNFEISGSSPCRNAGGTTPFSLDFDKDSRPNELYFDIGAQEYYQP